MPNQIPAVTTPYRLAIIGEGPVEEERGIPFSGNSGRLVSSVLSTLSLPVSRLFLGYVSTKRTFKYPQSLNDPAVIEGSEQLRKDLAVYKPNCCLLLGDLACKAFGAKHAVHYLRGSIFTSPVFPYKCVATLDPWQVIKQYSRLVPFQYDFLRAKEQSLFPDIKTRPRTVLSWPSYGQLCAELQKVLNTKPRITFDLEGYPNQTGVTCFSIATSPSHVFAVPLRNMDNSPFWAEHEECEIWRLTAAILGDPEIKKVAQNAMYELFVFAWRHKILVRGLTDDTMYRMWEVFSELPKGLDFISSIYTEEPYYKDERTVPDLATHLEYCCKDSLVTCEANEKMDQELKNPASRKHYQFNISLLKPYLYMQLRGCRLDLECVAQKRAATWDFIRNQQDVVNQMASQVLNTKSPKQLADYLYTTLGLPPQYVTVQGKKTITTNFNALCTLYQDTSLPVLLEIGKLTRSRTRFSDLNKLQAFSDGRIRCTYNPVGTDTGRLSSAETWVESIVTIPKIEFKKRTKNKVAYLEMVLSPKQLVENLGTNMQNVTKDLRDCFIPDNEDYDFFQYDLSGADAWTVAADLAALGNDKMLVHLQHKIKPSVVIVLLTEHGNDVYQWDLNTLKAHHDYTLKQCKTDPRLVRTYTGAKGCQHGCVTAGHEVLTRNGWIPIETLLPGVEIMTWKKDRAQWETPSFLTQYVYNGTLHSFKGTAYDLTVTHDHRMPYHTNGAWKETNASEMLNMKSGKLPVSADFFAGATLPPEFTKLLAAFHSDGCVNQKGKISFHFKKERKIKRLCFLLDENSIKFSVYYQSDNTVIIEFDNPNLVTIGKFTDWRMLTLSSDSMRLYLEETLHWDGHSATKTNVHHVIFTAVPLRAEVLNTMAQLCGFGSQLKINHHISGFGSKMSEISLNQRTKAARSSMEVSTRNVTNCPVYCVTVPSSFFFVRRNGHIMVTGNTNYGMQPTLMASLQLERAIQGWCDNVISGKPAGEPTFKSFHKHTMERLQNLYIDYYGLHLRNDYLRRQLCNHGYLDAAGGQRRYFLDIRSRKNIEDSVIRVAASHEPQANTTFATNAALYNLYYDRDNRTPRGNLRCEALIMVHDALCGQTHRTQRAWSTEKLETEWFSIPLKIHGIDITIPVEGGFGKNWKDTD